MSGGYKGLASLVAGLALSLTSLGCSSYLHKADASIASPIQQATSGSHGGSSEIKRLQPATTEEKKEPPAVCGSGQAVVTYYEGIPARVEYTYGKFARAAAEPKYALPQTSDQIARIREAYNQQCFFPFADRPFAERRDGDPYKRTPAEACFGGDGIPSTQQIVTLIDLVNTHLIEPEPALEYPGLFLRAGLSAWDYVRKKVPASLRDSASISMKNIANGELPSLRFRTGTNGGTGLPPPALPILSKHEKDYTPQFKARMNVSWDGKELQTVGFADLDLRFMLVQPLPFGTLWLEGSTSQTLYNLIRFKAERDDYTTGLYVGASW